jgi:hypothetical protein
LQVNGVSQFSATIDYSHSDGKPLPNMPDFVGACGTNRAGSGQEYLSGLFRGTLTRK